MFFDYSNPKFHAFHVAVGLKCPNPARLESLIGIKCAAVAPDAHDLLAQRQRRPCPSSEPKKLTSNLGRECKICKQQLLASRARPTLEASV